MKPLSAGVVRWLKDPAGELHFYFHDIVSGQKPTAVRVAEALMTNISLTGFGAVVMMDNALTETPDPKSKLEKSQGIYASMIKGSWGH